MDLSGAVLLDGSRRRVERGVPRPRVIGFYDDGRPIYSQRGGTSLWTNMECIYSMPGVGATKTTTAIQSVSAAAAADFALSSLWPVGNMLGKSLKFKASGTFDATAVTNLVQIGFGTTQGTLGTALAASGADTVASTTTGTWNMDVDATCVTQGSATTGWFADGFVDYGVFGATSAITGRFTVGGSSTAGVPNTVAIVPTTVFFWEVFSTWGTAPTAFVCAKYKIYAEN